jgi:alkylation response protein AidB-like acyl-CoA dehydrogenase
MYDLHLTPEQLHIRGTVREFVAREIKPVVLHPDRLQAADRYLPAEIFDKASHMGLRTLAVSEHLGGAGADSLTSCIVAEELAVGDADVASILAHTSILGHVLFDTLMTPGQRARFLPEFLANHRYHLAWAAEEPDAHIGWRYHRPLAAEAGVPVAATRQPNGEWVLNGHYRFVENAAVATLIAVRAAPAASEPRTFLVPRDAPGVAVREPDTFGVAADGQSVRSWYHGRGGALFLEHCRVPADSALGGDATGPALRATGSSGRGTPYVEAITLGVGRAAFEAALDYAKLRVQGGRPIIEHQAIGAMLAEIAIKLEVARATIWQAAWASDHPEAVAHRSIADLPLQTIARAFVSTAVHEATLKAAEVFGAMGVMRDMPMQKYVHDALVFLHSGDAHDAKLHIAEALAGYRRPPTPPSAT